MALIIPPGFLQAAYTITLAGDTEEMVVTCGHQIDSGSGANATDAANDLHTAFGLHMAVEMGTSYVFQYVTTYIGNDGPTIVNISDEAPVAGTQGSATLPPNSAVLFRKRTDLGGRRGRGRMYLPGIAEGPVDNVGIISDAGQVQLQAAADDWMESLTELVGGRLYPPVVIHRSEGIGVEPAPTPITRFVVAPKIATQRRRLRP